MVHVSLSVLTHIAFNTVRRVAVKALFIAIAIAAAASTAHATDRCTDAQWQAALSNAPARDGSKLVAKTGLEPNGVTVLVYDAQQESYPLVCERQYALPTLSEISPSARGGTVSAANARKARDSRT
jgi:hypothetical protein